jgi:hypothetical protein
MEFNLQADSILNLVENVKAPYSGLVYMSNK